MWGGMPVWTPAKHRHVQQNNTQVAITRRRTEPGFRFNRNISVKARGKSMKRNYFISHVPGLPQRERQTLSWGYNGGAITAIGASAFAEIAQIGMNYAFQPNATAGTSPAGFAKFMAQFTKAYTTNSKLYALLVNTGSTTQSPVVFGITLTTATAALTSYAQAVGAGLQTMRQIGVSPDQCTLTQSVDVKKFMGVTSLLDGSQFYSTSSTNPTQFIIAHVWVQNLSATPTDYSFAFKLDQDITFADPQPLT